jgi:hypothetical protein
MKPDRRLFGMYLGAGTYREFYGTVRDRLSSGHPLEDGYAHAVQTRTSGSLVGIFRILPYATVLAEARSWQQPLFEVKRVDAQKGEIRVRRRAMLTQHGGRISVLILAHDEGYWAEVRSEPDGVQKKLDADTTEQLIARLARLPVQRDLQRPAGLGSLDDRIREVFA